ncbi:MAG: hypothetical protein ACTSQO_09070 [Candidatus Helarchaeota archaeon]
MEPTPRNIRRNLRITKFSGIRFRRNEIESLPELHASLQNLKKLDLHSNNLKEISSAIKFFPSLERLYLSKNKIINLVPDFCLLDKLLICFLNKMN